MQTYSNKTKILVLHHISYDCSGCEFRLFCFNELLTRATANWKFPLRSAHCRTSSSRLDLMLMAGISLIIGSIVLKYHYALTWDMGVYKRYLMDITHGMGSKTCLNMISILMNNLYDIFVGVCHRINIWQYHNWFNSLKLNLLPPQCDNG